jgi:pimeloyl-ACP methyl ester carboxylesterase
MAHGAIAFISGLDLTRVELLGYSLGGFVAQEIALIRPDLVERIVLAATAPQGAQACTVGYPTSLTPSAAPRPPGINCCTRSSPRPSPAG